MPIRGAQLIPYPLPSVAWAASGSATTTLRDLPKTLFGRIAHLAAITFENNVTTNTGATLAVLAYNDMVTRLEITNGNQNLFVGDYNSLRFREAFENGGNRVVPNADSIATTETSAFSRVWNAGPPKFAGAPSDFVIPCGALENAEIRYGFPALTDLNGSTTAFAATITPVAWLMLLDEVRIPPVYEWVRFTSGAADLNLTGRALYAYLAISKDIDYAAFTALDVANVQVDTGEGQVVPNVHAAILTWAFNGLNGTGTFSDVVGDARVSGADGFKEQTTGTTLAATTLQYQPVIWPQPGCQISKLVAHAESVLRVRWSGADGTLALHAGRFLEQTETAVAAMAAKALGRLGLKDKGIKIKTLSKAPYTGPRPQYMPWSVKVR